MLMSSMYKSRSELQENLWSFSLQIAKGMAYLNTQRYIHRDVAARNCLVNKDMVVKISDFGLARALFTSDYYSMGDHRLLPIRWMAPETIQYTSQKFSLASDVWAYGVTIWEIFTHGQRPYFNLSNQDVLIKVPEGLTLDIPDDCPDVIKTIMSQCWQFEMDKRCSFDDIVQLLEARQFDNPSYDMLKESNYETPMTARKDGYIEVLVK